MAFVRRGLYFPLEAVEELWPDAIALRQRSANVFVDEIPGCTQERVR